MYKSSSPARGFKPGMKGLLQVITESETHLLQNFIQGLSVDDVVQSQSCLLFTLVCQLRSVRLDKTSVKLPDLWGDLRFHGAKHSVKKKQKANLLQIKSYNPPIQEMNSLRKG